MKDLFEQKAREIHQQCALLDLKSDKPYHEEEKVQVISTALADMYAMAEKINHAKIRHMQESLERLHRFFKGMHGDSLQGLLGVCEYALQNLPSAAVEVSDEELSKRAIKWANEMPATTYKSISPVDAYALGLRAAEKARK